MATSPRNHRWRQRNRRGCRWGCQAFLPPSAPASSPAPCVPMRGSTWCRHRKPSRLWSRRPLCTVPKRDRSRSSPMRRCAESPPPSSCDGLPPPRPASGASGQFVVRPTPSWWRALGGRRPANGRRRSVALVVAVPGWCSTAAPPSWKQQHCARSWRACSSGRTTTVPGPSSVPARSTLWARCRGCNDKPPEHTRSRFGLRGKRSAFRAGRRPRTRGLVQRTRRRKGSTRGSWS
mmetsp:Transcript_92589/g.188506  ORF Transcript_92589/g.188506 Transcript_92589/m.188506 type:complete len:234 (-) Transcript_92589:2424-3125(-)